MLTSSRCLSTTAVRGAQQTMRNAQTAVAKGTAFEQRSLAVARTRLSMSLRRVGGKSDGGIDLTGWWWLPHSLDMAQSQHASAGNAVQSQPHPRRRIRVLAQCKAEKKKIGPNYVREMEGVLYQYRGASPRQAALSLTEPPSSEDTGEDTDSSNGHPIVALFISESPFTKSTMLRALSSTVPFLLLHLPPTHSTTPSPSSSASSADVTDDTTIMGSILMNHALSRMLGGELEVRWERNLSDGRQSTDGMWTPGGRPGLYWKGRRLEPWTQDGDGYDDSASSWR
ncbi:uncharacterized protein SCHCODRAFT_02636375 [Schizophyllum commune H4-8]|uniref:Required for respiratory growth protein 7, mitochondrial n=1 Tax=Schizophyllum commune (strain H4-8 / FGSC 9210) TaxID=578458 RepID=D8QEE8_SCHCM|nr:uncharacterized protein SCHCODRAFT_02636375 [Schizophyllum commune H4-8]KAI5888315.1 hypothetical protein SCHCODRAFT_02636375 [Schizophyllum commune H4-8]